MTLVLLCAGPGLLVIQKDGLLFYRRPGQPDAPVPYSPAHYPVFLRSAKQKHGLTPVLGPSGEEAPCLPEEPAMPALRRECLPTGDEIYRLVSGTNETAEQAQQDRPPLPRKDERAVEASMGTNPSLST
jgi:hypothetical protein